MALAAFRFVERMLAPPAAAPIVRPPNRRWQLRSVARPAALLRLRVAEIVTETPSTKTFVFDEPGLAYEAGQHLTLTATIDGRVERRCYSLSTAPGAGGLPAITVKRVEGGVVSSWLHDSVRCGDVLEAAPAAGRFTVHPDASSARHLVLVAGGVGITPLLSIAASLLCVETSSRVTLLYGSRSEDEIIFRARLEAMQRMYGRRFDLVFAVDEAGAGWKGLVGPLAGERIVSVMKGTRVDAWYLCGPEAMMDSAARALAEAGVDAAQIHSERFQYAEAAAVEAPRSAATLVFARSGKTVVAPAGTTILEAAEAAGIALPSSCRMGGCGACRIGVEGRVVAAEPNCLSEEEKAQGQALSCCSYGDGRVVLCDF